MEAVPRLPMISFDLKVSTENVSFGPQLKQYISSFYNEDPESYNPEISKLESLRGAAARPTIDVAGCQLLKRYYCQLHFLKSRFPMGELQGAAVYFSWKDTYTSTVISVPDIRFELMCILYNIGALHSQLGALDSRTSPDGMQMACTHFQCAAWAFQTIKENYYQMITLISPIEVIHYMQQVCLAQAQECILEKSMMDNRKATVIVKVAVQVVDYYKRALIIHTNGDENPFSDFVGRTCVYWVKYLSFKIAYHKGITLLFQGQQAEEQQKMGERVAFYQAASDQLDEARKLASNLKQQKEIAEALAFTSDVVEGKRKAAKNENEFIYHEEVPEKDALPDVKGAPLVKGIPFNVNDVEVSGPDIFARLVPMEAHEASSLYSEKKAQMLRQIGELVENKDRALAEFLSSMQLDIISQRNQVRGIPQDLIDRAAALSAKPTATNELQHAMAKLSQSFNEVETMLNEIQELLKNEEQAEKEYQEQMGKRPPSIIATDLSREATKYREAHTKANDSNQHLHKAMTTHVANLNILGQPIINLTKQIPSIQLPDPNIDEDSIKEIENLVAKIEEMRSQRTMLWNKFRDTVHEDDITNVLITRQSNQSLDQLFQQELQKHQHFASLIEQNAAAQENILKAMVDAYAHSTNSRKYIQDIINKRNTTIGALITSYDTYEELLAKANKGIEFYNKLETNVGKLLQRIKSACKVQQEERDQILSKNSTTKEEIVVQPVPTNTPKLKDYLDSRKKNQLKSYNDQTNLNQQYPSMVYPGNDPQIWPPAVRPAPLGSEVNSDGGNFVKNTEQNVGYTNTAFTHIHSIPKYRPDAINYDQGNLDQVLSQRIAALRTSSKNDSISYSNQQPINYSQYNYLPTNDYISSVPMTSTTINNYSVNQNYEASKATTITTNSYQPISSVVQNTQYPLTSLTNPTGIYSNYASTDYTKTYNQADYNQTNTNLQLNPYQVGNVAGFNAATNETNYYPQQYSQSSVEYSTSVPGNISNLNYNSTYSAPSIEMKSSNSSNLNYLPNTSINQTNYSTNTEQVYPSYNYDTTNQQYQMINPQYSMQNYGSYSNYYGSMQSDSSQQYVTPSVSNYYVNNTVQYPGVASTVNQISGATSTSSTSLPTPLPTSLPTPLPTAVPAAVVTKESNIDLLAGLDFNITQAPLIPQQNNLSTIVQPEKEIKPEIPVIQTITKTTKEEIVKPKVTIVEKIVNRKPLNNMDVYKIFSQEIDKFEKFVDVLSNKTLSGPTNLDLKWKEIQDKQESDGQKKVISVARCYPMKNRFPDILPYDYSRVELISTKDDYINASYVKDISLYTPPFIITQAPLSSTFGDFWTMIREQQVEMIVCILSKNEIKDDIYWPTAKGKDLYVENMVISLKSEIIKSSWVERLITIAVPEKRDSKTIIHLQFTKWPGSLFPSTPESLIVYIQEVLTLYYEQHNFNNPIAIHCLSGIGRSGVVALLMTAILEVTNNQVSIPDLISLTLKLTACKKNILRDREHLKFAFEAFLCYMKQIISLGQKKKKLSDVVRNDDNQDESNKTIVKTEEISDPLSNLDPFWASKKM